MNAIKKILFLLIILNSPSLMYAWEGMPTPPLHADGRDLVDSSGNKVLLHGLAMTPNPWFNGCMHGTCRWDNYDTVGCLNYIKSFLNTVTDTTLRWFCNLLRWHIDPYWSNDGPTEGEHDISQFNYDKFVGAVNNVIVPVVEYARSRGMYVIIRPPGVCPQRIDVNDSYYNYLMTVWNYVSQHAKLRNADNVMFELANEPVEILGTNGVWGQSDQAHFDKLKLFFQPIVDTIRANGANNVIWIPGLGYQSHYSGFANNPIEGENIGYAVHIYPGYWGQNNNNPATFRNNWNKNIKPVADFAPIAVTEINWAPEEYGAWGIGTTGTAGVWGFGSNFKALADESGNVSWNLLGPEDLMDKGNPNGKIAYDNDTEACANAVYKWFQEYAGKEVIINPDIVPPATGFNIKKESDNSPCFRLFPNPSNNGHFTIVLNHSSAIDCKLSVFSLEGRKVYEKNNLVPGDNNINVTLSRGVYFVKIENYRKIEIMKLEIQ
jgi:endoglucanase